MFDVIIIGGGAAGFFAAIRIAENSSNLKVAILEKGKGVLAKVKVSGGGRCNVTHAEFDPRELSKNYPRGEKEILGPFHKFCSGDTVAFFEERGVQLKIEEDGRMFPTSNSSQTIIDCFLNEASKLGIQILKHSTVTKLAPSKEDKNLWNVTTIKGSYSAKKVLVCSGSSPKVWDMLKNLGHSIVNPVPSLFTFNIKDDRISKIPGVSTNARVKVYKQSLSQLKLKIKLKSQRESEALLDSEGPVLITHWGLSGPAILKLSAWGANILHDLKYNFVIKVNWLPEYHSEAVLPLLMEIKEVEVKKTVLKTKALDIPRRLWINLVRAADIPEQLKWADVSKVQLQELANQLTDCRFLVNGKSTFKDEFVTAGGVDLKEINFKTFESKIHKNLFFAGEVINVDAITGGFNFQNAWTTGYLAAEGITKEV